MAVSTPSRVEARAPSVPDTNVQPFLQQDFDPADYLNSTLPSLSVSSTSRSGQPSRSVALPELSSQLQSLLTRLNAQTLRLSTSLTQLTDEILRSGGRLAYEVEVLRGETVGLTDSLESGLKKDIELFAPATSEHAGENTGASGGSAAQDVKVMEQWSSEPEYLLRLKTLTVVRSRLDSVIKVFGEAMQWPIAPSELSATSSLISISAPDAGADTRSREDKGKAYAERLRTEINDLIGSGNDIASLEAAAERIEELRELAEVWKGTAEEKARTKFVENLQKPVEERQKALEKAFASRRTNAPPARGVDYRYGSTDTSRAVSEGGYGFLQNLRNLKNDMYIE